MNRRIAIGAALLAIVVLSLLPTGITDLASNPAPATSYADAVARIEARQAGDDRIAVPGGRTIFLTHGGRTARVVVLFHGLTNSPRQYDHLAGQLFAEGDNVYIPRLPHHAEKGGRAATLSALTAEELRDAGDSAVDIADGLADTVVVAGVSAGGTISAWLAQNRVDVRRAVIIAPLLEIGRLPPFLDVPLMNLALRTPNITHNLAPDSLRPDRELGVTSRAVAQILRLAVSLRRSADLEPARTRDIVFVTNGNDHTVLGAPVIQLARRWSQSGASVTEYQFPRSLGLPHDITEEEHVESKPAIVNPALEALIHGERPAPILADHRLWPPLT